MNWSQGGDFTKSLLSLQLQLQTLLEGVGGADTAGLLDALAKLSDTERGVIIPALTKVVLQVASGEKRLQSESDKELEAFENELFESVLSAMGDAATGESQATNRDQAKKLAVVSGGKSSDVVKFKKPVRISSPIDLCKARENRKKGSFALKDRDLM